MLAFAGAGTGTAHAQAEYNPLSGPIQISPENFTEPPPGYRHDALSVIRAAVATGTAQRLIRRHGEALRIRPFVRGGTREWWVVFAKRPRVLLEVNVDDRNGEVTAVWEGFQADWYIARGTEGLLVQKLNAPYVWLPLCALFLLPFFDPRRPLRMLHFDLLALLAFGVSHIFFNRGELETSVWLIYPVLAYLSIRLATLAWRPRRGTGPLVPYAPLGLLVAGIVGLVALRLVLTFHFSANHLMDVGFASVIGADRIVSGDELYVLNNARGDTYGPFAYLAYIPFEQLWPWDGGSDAFAPAKAAATVFDLVTMAGLFVVGRQLRAGRPGTLLGVALAYAWAAYPYTAYTLVGGTNDALISALLVWALVGLRFAPVRGALVALAAAAKFAPLAVLPLVAAGPRRSRREAVVALTSAGVVLVAVIVPFIPDGGLREMYDTTIGWQVSRGSPFSPWGQDESLKPLQLALEAVGIGVAAAALLLRAPRGPATLAALGALVLIAVQAPATHWFFFYIVWFAPWTLVAFFAPYPSTRVNRLPEGVGAPMIGRDLFHSKEALHAAEVDRSHSLRREGLHTH